MNHNGSYKINPVKHKEGKLVEKALKKHNIPFSKSQTSELTPEYTTLEIPEMALRDEGFLVWGDRFNLICRIRKALRRKH